MRPIIPPLLLNAYGSRRGPLGNGVQVPVGTSVNYYSPTAANNLQTIDQYGGAKIFDTYAAAAYPENTNGQNHLINGGTSPNPNLLTIGQQMRGPNGGNQVGGNPFASIAVVKSSVVRRLTDNFFVSFEFLFDNTNGAQNGLDNSIGVLCKFNDGNYAAGQGLIFRVSAAQFQADVIDGVGGTQTTFVTQPYSITFGTWYAARMEVIGSNVQFFQDGVSIATGSGTFTALAGFGGLGCFIGGNVNFYAGTGRAGLRNFCAGTLV